MENHSQLAGCANTGGRLDFGLWAIVCQVLDKSIPDRENSMFEGFVVGGVRTFEEVTGGPHGLLTSRSKIEGK